MEKTQPKDLSDLELATHLSQETNKLAQLNQEAQMHAQNIQLLQQEINLRNQPKPKAEEPKAKK